MQKSKVEFLQMSALYERRGAGVETQKKILSVDVVQMIQKTKVEFLQMSALYERWGAGVETQKNVRGEVGRWGRVPFNEPYAPLLSTIYDGA